MTKDNFIKIKAVSKGHNHVVRVDQILRVSDNSDVDRAPMKASVYLKEGVVLYCTETAEEILPKIVGAMDTGLSEEEQDLHEGILQAREVQEFIWGSLSLTGADFWDRDAWLGVFGKRLQKIAEIDPTRSSSMIELKKRVLQQAALSIAALKVINKALKNGK